MLNIVIKLLCVISRFNWNQIPLMKNIVNDVISRIKDDSINSQILPFKIFTELIYQFQSTENMKNNNFYKSKLKKTICEFKEISLLPIFEYANNILFALFQHEIKTEKIEDFICFINEILKCLNECLDYEDDINAKEDNYSQYEIKPVYIPNNKKRTRDKTLDANLLSNLIQNLFDTYSLILKVTTDEKKSCFSLLILQKLLVMKIMYLGENKNTILRIYQDGICSILFSKTAHINHENICKLIFYIKKNYTHLDILTNENFISYIFAFAKETLEHIKKKEFCEYMKGMIYLLRFFGYFSHSINSLFVGMKETIKNFINSLLIDFLTSVDLSQIIKEDANLFEDIAKSFGICGECVYVELVEKICEMLKKEERKNLCEITRLINFGYEVIKRNYKFYLDDKMINKTNCELINFSLVISEQGNDLKDINTVNEYIIRTFEIINNMNNSIFDGNNENISFNISMVKFIKFFIKNFLNPNLSNKFMNVFSQINEIIKINTSSDFLIFILKKLMQISSTFMHKDTRITPIVTKTLSYLLQSIQRETDFVFNDSDIKIMLGKMYINKEELLNSLRNILKTTISYTKLDLKLHKKFLIFIFSVFQLTSLNAIELYINYYLTEISNQNSNDTIEYTINSVNALITSIENKNDYEITIEKIMPYLLSNLQNYFLSMNKLNDTSIQILRLLCDITTNTKNRVYFANVSQSPYHLLSLSKEFLCHYYKIAKEIAIMTEKDKYVYQIKPISLYIKIFLNMFNIIQLSLLVHSNYDYIKTLFDLLSELIFSISSQDLIAYLHKLYGIFDLIKIIFCDFITVKESICDYSKIMKIVEYIYLCYDYESEFNLTAKSINDIIFVWGKLRLENDMKNAKIAKEVFENEKNKDLFLGILQKIFTFIIEDNIAFNDNFEDLCKTAFILINIYPQNYSQLANDLIVNSSLNIAEKEKMNSLFKELNTLYVSYDEFNSSFFTFKDKMQILYKTTKEIILNHRKEN